MQEKDKPSNLADFEESSIPEPSFIRNETAHVFSTRLDTEGHAQNDVEHRIRLEQLKKYFKQQELDPGVLYTLINSTGLGQFVEITLGGHIRTGHTTTPDQLRSYTLKATMSPRAANSFIEALNHGGDQAANALNLLEEIKREDTETAGPMPEFDIDQTVIADTLYHRVLNKIFRRPPTPPATVRNVSGSMTQELRAMTAGHVPPDAPVSPAPSTEPELNEKDKEHVDWVKDLVRLPNKPDLVTTKERKLEPV